MLVCICKGISDRRIAEEIRAGNRSLREIQQCCGAATDCGTCARQIREMIGTSGVRAHDRSDAAGSNGG